MDEPPHSASLTFASSGGRRVAFVLLAAGGSSRMGQPKQLLEVEGKSLIQKIVGEAMNTSAWPIVVVTGRETALIRRELARFPILLAENASWEKGMGTSVRAGVAASLRFSDSIDGVLLSLCDQPRLTSNVIQTLLDAFATQRGIVAARYDGVCGAPAVFDRTFFAALSCLEDQEGAQRLIRNHSASVTPIDFGELSEDLDTPEDYARFIGKRE